MNQTERVGVSPLRHIMNRSSELSRKPQCVMLACACENVVFFTLLGGDPLWVANDPQDIGLAGPGSSSGQAPQMDDDVTAPGVRAVPILTNEFLRGPTIAPEAPHNSASEVRVSP